MNTKQKILAYMREHQQIISGEKLANELQVSRTAIWKAIRELEKSGYRFDHLANGYRLLPSDMIEPALISNSYLPEELIFYQPSTASTMQEAKKAAIEQHLTQGLFIADEQTQGHGRFGRSFFSPSGQIYMSLLLSPNQNFQELPQYTILSAVAVASAIDQLVGEQTAIKWVNDIFIREKKVCGILTEAISDFETQRISHVIIGIGINFFIAQEQFPEELRQKVTALFHEQPTITRNELIRLIWQNFFELCIALPDRQYLDYYRQKSFVLNQQVTFSQNGEKITGIAQAITDKGELVVQAKNQVFCLSSGEISLEKIETPK